MKKILILISCFYVLINSVSAQKHETITVRAGTKILDYFPVSERYLYPEFITGRVYLKSGIHSERQLNYNYLRGEIEFIQARDTLSIINKKDIIYLAVAQDTFYFDKGYIKLLRSGVVMVGLKELIELKEIQNKDSYGTSSSGSATNSYGSLPADGNFYKLTANKDMVFQRKLEYYFAIPESGFVPFNRKNLLQMFPRNETRIKSYLKTNKVKFDSEDDILRLTDFLRTLLI